MAVKEFYTSREMDVTMEGTTLTAIVKCTWADWDDEHEEIPRVGDSWPWRDDMLCSHVNTRTIDNVNCTITAVFSTEAMEADIRRENQAASWEEQIDMTLSEDIRDNYFSYVDNKVHDWPSDAIGHITGVTDTDTVPLLHKSR